MHKMNLNKLQFAFTKVSPSPFPSNRAAMADMAVAAPAAQKVPPKFKQRTVRTFKSKAPKPGQKG